MPDPNARNNTTRPEQALPQSELLDDLLQLLVKIYDNPEMDKAFDCGDTTFGRLSELYVDCGGEELFFTFPNLFI